jgi:tungstate transport system permease protein
MNENPSIYRLVLHLLFGGDPAFIEIIVTSLQVTLSAVALATAAGLPLGAMLALTSFPGRSVVIVLTNAFMGFPPVVLGLLVFLLLSRSGPLGTFGLLFTPAAMIVSQFLLVLPIIVALTRQIVEMILQEYHDYILSLGLSRISAVRTVLWDARFSLVTAILAGLGRATAEVGSILIVGGNIAGYTRTMTTAIALETSKGDLPLALALGSVLIGLTVLINGLAYTASRIGARYDG